MNKELREKFNASFTQSHYDAYVQKIAAFAPGSLDFRIAETPLFISKEFKHKILDACEAIIDCITDKDFKKQTSESLPKNHHTPNEDDHSHMLIFDFGICQNNTGELEPQLIEMQGFPSLFAYQLLQNDITKDYAEVPNNYDAYLNGYNKESYTTLLKEVIIGNHPLENVILLEIFPEEQKTRIDFYCTEKLLGIKTVCLTKLIREDNRLYYDNNGKKTLIKRIYNRIIFDDLQQQNTTNLIDLTVDYEVEWVPHPNWFYRISKFTLPFIHHPYVPETYFLNEVKSPLPLEEYVLKPLFSFAGMGVILNVNQEDIDKIDDPENWILQKKVQYAPVIKTLDEPAKAEIRLFYFWKKEWSRPLAIHNLARLTKGEMIGTRYNQNKTWVGGSIAFFEKD